MSNQQAQTCHSHVERQPTSGCDECGALICHGCQRGTADGIVCSACFDPGDRSDVAVGPTEAPGEVLAPRWWQRPVPMGTTLSLIGANVAVWAALSASGGRDSALKYRIGLLPSGMCVEGHYYNPEVHDGFACSLLPGKTWFPGVRDGALWQIFTYAFAHLTWVHLVTNMAALLLLGPLVESRLGRARLLAVYLLSALAGSAAICWLADAHSSTLGASGAIYGLAVTQIILSWRLRHYGSLILAVAITAVLLLFAGDRHTSWQCHLGGVLGGLAAALVVGAHRNRDRLGLAGLGVILTLAIAVWAAAAH